jgi:MFS family permease
MNNDKTSQPPAVKQKLFYGYIIVLIAFLVMAIFIGSRAAFGIFLKPMLADLELSRGLITGAFSLSQLITGVLSILAGRFSDKLGSRSIITICGLLLGTGYLLMSLVTTTWQLYLFYGVVIGIGGTVYVPIMSTVARWFKTRRNMMTGIVGTGSAIGILSMPLLADKLISTYDWHVSFALLGIIILIVVVVSAQFLRTAPNRLGQITPAENTHSELNYQLKSNDISLRKAISTRRFWLCAMVFFVIGFCPYSIIVHIAPYATDQGISAANAASILSLIGGMGIVSRPIMGSIGDRFGENRAILICFMGMSAATIWLMFAKELWMLYPFAVAFGFFSSAGTLGSSLIAEIFGLSSHGAILGACNFGFSIGIAIGPLIAGYIFDLTNNYEIAFFIVITIAILGIVVMLLLQSIQAKQGCIPIKD